MRNLHACLLCAHTHIEPYLTCTDHTVSRETFNIVRCGSCGFTFTNPVPDEDEIGRYYEADAYISHSNTNKGLVAKAYQLVRNRAVRQKAGFVQRTSGFGTGQVLDIGCGTGSFLAEMARRGWTARGLEPSPAARAAAHKHLGLAVMETKALWDLEVQSYHAITLWHVLEHVHPLHEYAAQLQLLLKPSGTLFIAVPNHHSHDAAHYGANWAAYDVPRHLYHFSPDSMARLLARHKFRIAEMHLMPYDAYYVSLLSERCLTGRVNFLNAYKVGRRSNTIARKDVKRSSSILYVVKREG